MKKYIVTYLLPLALLPSVEAVIIYEASSSTSTTLIDNGGAVNASSSGDTATGNFTINPSANAPIGFTSTSNIQTLNGGSIALTDTITISLGLVSVGDLNNIGIEFGLMDDNAFRNNGLDDGALYIRTGISSDRDALWVDDGVGGNEGDFSITSGNDDGPHITEGSMRDGFSATLTMNKAGYSFTLSDVAFSNTVGGSIDTGLGTVVTHSGGTWANDAEFLDVVNTGHFYFTAQFQSNGPGNDAVLDIANIDIVPEPSTYGLIAGCFSLAAVMIRRRRL